MKLLWWPVLLLWMRLPILNSQPSQALCRVKCGKFYSIQICMKKSYFEVMKTIILILFLLMKTQQVLK